MQSQLKFKGIWFALAASIILIAGSLATYFTNVSTDARERNSVLTYARTAAASLDTDELRQLGGSKSDLASPNYTKLKEILSRIKGVNPDVRFVYLMGYRGGDKVFFFMDSEPKDSPDISLPGDIYEDTTQEEINGYLTSTPFVEGPVRDQWGNWVSAFSPVLDPQEGKVLALLGMDIDASLFETRIRNATLVPILVSLFALFVLFVAYLRHRGVREWIGKVAEEKEFISLASHQLKSPVATIRESIEILQGSLKDKLNPDDKEFLDQIHKSNLQINDLVNDLLSAAQLELGTFEIILTEENIVSIAKNAVTDLETLFKERNQVLKTNFEDNVPTLKLDRKIVSMVIQNLLTNANKYSPNGGVVELSVKRNNGNVVVECKDNGLGIPKSQQADIFKKMFRADNARSQEIEGTGLGLYIIKTLVESVGCKISFESEENKGTTFRFTIPLKGMSAKISKNG